MDREVESDLVAVGKTATRRKPTNVGITAQVRAADVIVVSDTDNGSNNKYSA